MYVLQLSSEVKTVHMTSFLTTTSKYGAPASTTIYYFSKYMYIKVLTAFGQIYAVRLRASSHVGMWNEFVLSNYHIVVLWVAFLSSFLTICFVRDKF